MLKESSSTVTSRNYNKLASTYNILPIRILVNSGTVVYKGIEMTSLMTRVRSFDLSKPQYGRDHGRQGFRLLRLTTNQYFGLQ